MGSSREQCHGKNSTEANMINTTLENSIPFQLET